MSNFEDMREEARCAIVEALPNYTGYGADFHNEVFNIDYYECYTDRAEKQLEEMGVFDCIHMVQEYEQDNFGVVNTDLSEPCDVLNMVWYIIGEEELYTMFENCELWDDFWNEEFEEETGKQLVDWLRVNANFQVD